MLTALNQWVSQLRGAIGRERSIRLTKAGVVRGRWLFTVPLAMLGPDPEATLAPLVTAWQLDETAWQSFRAELPQFAFIHLGLEPDSVVKLYGEYRTGPRRHRAFKWSPGQPAIETIYTTIQPESVAQYIYEHHTQHGCWEVMANLLQYLQMRPIQGKVGVLEVTEPQTGRTSYDINIYPFGVTGVEFAPLLNRMAKAIKLPPDELAGVQEDLGTMTIGHIAGGVHRDGKGFFTLYYGAEELQLVAG